LNYLNSVDQGDIDSINEHVKFGYYRNGRKHFSALLSRMVASGLITRIKPGIFKAGPGRPNKPKLATNMELYFNEINPATPA
jgi:hypothetical protein